MATYDHFYDLPVYKTCRAFRKRIAEIVRQQLPGNEEYRLKAQVLNASRSVTANLAEGFGRFHHQENIQFSRRSRGSLTETMDHMITAFDEGYINDQVLKEINEDYKNCLKELNSYFKYLKSAKATSQNQ